MTAAEALKAWKEASTFGADACSHQWPHVIEAALTARDAEIERLRNDVAYLQRAASERRP